MATEDLWHVEVEPGEVKVMSLEQLDDLYRLEVISASTKVWQKGMTEWLPLAIIAGLEDDVEEIDAVLEVDDEPPGPTAATSGMAKSSAPPPPSARSAGAAAAASASLPPSSAAPVVPPPSSAAPASLPPRSSGPALSAAAPATGSLSPHLISDDANPPSRASVRIERALIAAGIAAGVLIALYRNDVLFYAARASGQSTAYEKVETTLGAPGFGTPRSLVELRKLSELDAAAAMKPEGAAGRPKAQLTELATDRLEPEPEPEPNEPQQGSNASNQDQAQQGKADDEPKAKPNSGSSQQVPQKPASKPKGKGKNIGVKGSSDAYDPLNPQL